MPFALLALLAVSTATAQPAPSPGATAEVVPLTFAWTAGTVARVEVSRVRIREDAEDAVADTLSVAFSYAMRVTDHPDGLLVSNDVVFGSDRDGAPPGEAADGGAAAQAFAAVTGGLLPDRVVSNDGRFLRLDGVSELIARHRSFLVPYADSVWADDPATAVHFDEVMERLLDEEVLTEVAENAWFVTVEAWAGEEMEAGAAHAADSSEATAEAGAPQMTVEFGLVGWVPCTEEGIISDDASAVPTSDAPCVLIEIVASYDEATKEALAAEFFWGVLEGSADVMEVELGQGASVVTDPTTLMPSFILSYREAVGATKGQEGEAETFFDYFQEASWYTYER